MRALILGGGLAGISAAANLPEGWDAVVLEKESGLGGLLRTDQVGSFLFDHGPHLFFHTDPYFISIFEKATRDIGSVLRPAKTGQRSFGTYVEFPYAVHLKNLPSEVVAKCVADFAARQVTVASEAVAPHIANYEAYCRHYFGDGFTDHFMIPYAVKIWTVHPRDLATDWVGQRIVLPDLKEVVRGALLDRSLAGNYIKEFRYPRQGGTQTFVNGMSRMMRPGTTVRTDSEVAEIDVSKKSVRLTSGAVEHYDVLISSLPLPILTKLTTRLPKDVVAASEHLDWFGVLLMNFGSCHLAENPYQWIYFDQNDAVFHRIHYPSKLADYMAPEGAQSLQAEMSFSRHRALPETEDNLLEIAWRQMREVGLVSGRVAPEIVNYRRVPFAYAIMDQRRPIAVATIRSFYEEHGVLTCGRFGEWDYIWTDKVLLSGKKAAEKLETRSPRSTWL